MADWPAIYKAREQRDKRRIAIADARLRVMLASRPWWWEVLCKAVMEWRHKHKRRPFEGDMGCGHNAIDEMGGYQSNAYREYEEVRSC